MGEHSKQGFPALFSTYLNYCPALRFEDRPDYNYLRGLFEDFVTKEGLNYDGVLYWSQLGQTTGNALPGESTERDDEGSRASHDTVGQPTRNSSSKLGGFFASIFHCGAKRAWKMSV